jgi:hypothetical protein
MRSSRREKRGWDDRTARVIVSSIDKEGHAIFGGSLHSRTTRAVLSNPKTGFARSAQGTLSHIRQEVGRRSSCPVVRQAWRPGGGCAVDGAIANLQQKRRGAVLTALLAVFAAGPGLAAFLTALQMLSGW